MRRSGANRRQSPDSLFLCHRGVGGGLRFRWLGCHHASPSAFAVQIECGSCVGRTSWFQVRSIVVPRTPQVGASMVQGPLTRPRRRLMSARLAARSRASTPDSRSSATALIARRKARGGVGDLYSRWRSATNPRRISGTSAHPRNTRVQTEDVWDPSLKWRRRKSCWLSWKRPLPK